MGNKQGMDAQATFVSTSDALPHRLAGWFGSRRPVRAGLAVGVGAYVLVTVLLVALGLTLTRVDLDVGIGRWDASVERWLFEHRTATLDAVTSWGSGIGDTFSVIGVALVAVTILAIGRRWAHIGFLVGALLIEVTTFVTTTFLVDRERPTVPHLDEGPPTSSFPSGHIAASIVLYVGLAIVITSLIRNTTVRIAAWVIAFAIPMLVAFSRLYRGMHFPTDAMGSVVGAVACLGFAFLAVRTEVAARERRTADVERAPSPMPDDETQVPVSS